jgi:chromosome segregation ATPase
LAALANLTTEKQSLEQELSETVLLLKTKSFLVETAEAKVSELEAQNNNYKEVVSGLKTKVKGFQKFVDGLGKDYDTLREKNTFLSRKLDEIVEDGQDLRSVLYDAKGMVARVDENVQEWTASSRTLLREAQMEIEKRKPPLYENGFLADGVYSERSESFSSSATVGKCRSLGR